MVLEKKERVIILGTTANMTFAVANVLIGLKKHSPNIQSDFIVYHDGITEKDKQIFNSIFPINFINYTSEINATYNLQRAIARYSLLAFSKYESFNWLKDYKQVLWLDYDLLIQKDISKMFEIKEGISLLPEKTKLKDCFHSLIDNYDPEKPNCNSGVMILNDNLPNYEELTGWCYRKTEEYSDNLVFPDQGIINIMAQEFNIEINPLEEKFNCHPTLKTSKNAVIVHAYAPQKFWKWWDFDYHFKEWDKNYKQWLKIGGSPYTGEKHDKIDRWAKRIHHNCPHPVRRPTKFLKFMLSKEKN